MSPVPAPAPVTPGGGHPSTMYDATTDAAALHVDGGVIQILAGFDFHSHGDLFNVGPTVNGGAQPIWGDPTSALWHDKGNFGFFYGGPFGVEAFEFWMAYGADPGLTMDMSPTANTLNLFLKAGQQGTDAAFVLWDEDGVKSLTFGDPDIDGGTDGPNATVWWSPDGASFVGIYSVDGNPEIDLVGPNGGAINLFGGDACGIAMHAASGQTDNDLLRMKGNSSQDLFRVSGHQVGFYGNRANQSVAGTTAADAIACLKAFGLMHA